MIHMLDFEYLSPFFFCMEVTDFAIVAGLTLLYFFINICFDCSMLLYYNF